MEQYHSDMQNETQQNSGPTLNLAIEELFRNKSYADDVVKYCCSVYGENKDQTIEQTTTYMNDTLGAVASHISVVAANVSHYLNLQDKQLEGLELEVETLNQRLHTAHRKVARKASCLRPRQDSKRDCPGSKVKQLSGSELPEKAKALPKFDAASCIDYSTMSVPIQNIGSVSSLNDTKLRSPATTLGNMSSALHLDMDRVASAVPMPGTPSSPYSPRSSGPNTGTSRAPPPPPVPSRRSSPPPPARNGQ